ncbi:hypothetical protein F7725_005649 [Dissostichus mawsoni]|uniref:Peptidoglycan recognition protein family domain-containing protein n=1 Tax=Dissostichus mawsoni TaxID=36200 RepID=A0A7J5YRW4_DISMA|nr:hypothetical protein F7725_005649 [Dissostichus mawsoni]
MGMLVVGSDGYVYEGRGWNYLGTHTRGHNSIGYGVSIIGNYTAALPSHHAMDLLRHRLVQCAVDGGGLAANFIHPGPQTGGELHLLPWRRLLFRNKKLGTLQGMTV